MQACHEIPAEFPLQVLLFSISIPGAYDINNNSSYNKHKIFADSIRLAVPVS